MDENKSYSELGKEIVSSLAEGLKTGDLTRLNESITDSVDKVLGDVENKLNVTSEEDNSSYSPGSYTKLKQEQLQKEREERKKAIEEARQKRLKAQKERRIQRTRAVSKTSTPAKTKAEVVPFKPVGDVSSVLYTVFGGIGTGVTGILTVGGLSALIAGGPVSALLVPGVLFVTSLGFLENGILQRKRLGRARRYLQLSKDQKYIEIEKLASSVGEKPKKVLRDLRKLLKSGYFPQGHIDVQDTNFMLTDAVYEQYLQTQKSYERLTSSSQEVIDTTAREVNENDIDSPEKELENMIADGNAYITKLQSLNEKIPGEVISDKLDKLEALLKEIFRCVKIHPEQMPRMHELMDYYLPTTVKLMEAYDEYDKISVKGPEIVSAMSDIENTLDTINEAFIKLLNNLFKDSVWDVTTDAQVLKDVLVQKGLAQDMKNI